jgi:DNA-binding NarL/FixJ family response regulator
MPDETKSMKLINLNLRVLLQDSDYYALQAINGYLAWDRRTRVTFMAESVEAMWTYLDHTATPELPDVIVLDADHIGGPDALTAQTIRLRARIPDVLIVCLAQLLDLDLIRAAIDAGARAYLLKAEVRLQIAWAIAYATEHRLLVTPGIAAAAERFMRPGQGEPTILPARRAYPELTERIRQAIELCVVKGMPAHLAADEMGISLHTIRSYIKEGYRILEAYDGTEYPSDMSPQERAFMRLTKPDDPEDD